MSLYENIFIIRQDLAPSQVEALKEKFITILTKNGAEVGHSEYSGLRQLTYPIKKSHKGHYLLLNITGDGAAIKELERHMRLSEDVIRFLTVQVEEHSTQPSALMQQPRPPRGNFSPRKDFDSDRPDYKDRRSKWKSSEDKEGSSDRGQPTQNREEG